MNISNGLEIVYSQSRWTLLNRLQKKALEIMSVLSSWRLDPAIYGSVCRGDVKSSSDIDIIIPYVISSNKVELALTMSNFKIFSRTIEQATPSHAIKAHLYLDIEEKLCVTFPLLSFRTLELEFYRFGGSLDLPSLTLNKRVPGCNRKLKLIQPTILGHIEFPVIGYETEAAKVIGVSLEIVKERVRVLTRRKKIGRTGLVLSERLGEDEVFEDVLRRLTASNPIVKRRVKARS